MLSAWDWMDGWKITEILYAALSWELSKQMWFLAQHDMILAELHPKIHGRAAGLSCVPASALLRGLLWVLHARDSGWPRDWHIHQGPPGCQESCPTCATPGKVTQPCSLPPFDFYLSPFGVQSLNLPASRSTLIYCFLRGNSTSLPTAMLCR